MMKATFIAALITLVVVAVEAQDVVCPEWCETTPFPLDDCTGCVEQNRESMGDTMQDDVRDVLLKDQGKQGIAVGSDGGEMENLKFPPIPPFPGK